MEEARVGARLATMVPATAAFLNSGVWVFYMAAVEDKNISQFYTIC